MNYIYGRVCSKASERNRTNKNKTGEHGTLSSDSDVYFTLQKGMNRS